MYCRKTTKKEAHSDSIWTVSWGISNHIISGAVDGTVKRWEHNEGVGESEEVKTPETLTHSSSFEGHQLGVVSTTVHPGGNLLATTCVDCRIRIFDMQDCSLIKEIDAGAVESWTGSFSGLKPHIATGSQSGAINIFSYETGEKVKSMDTKGGFVMSVAYSPDGQSIASGCNGGMVSVFDAESNKEIMKHTTSHTMPVRSVAFSKDGM
jgi:WD repeat-containing protein 61